MVDRHRRSVGSRDSLFNLCVRCVVKNLAQFNDSLEFLPNHIKNRILKSHLLRGPVGNLNTVLAKLLNKDTKELTLAACTITNQTLNILEAGKGLEILNLRSKDINISCAALKRLFGALRNLQRVGADCAELNDEVFVTLMANSRGLHELRLFDSVITDAGLLGADLGRLKAFQLSKSAITGEGLNLALKDNVLEELSVEFASTINNEIIDKILETCPRVSMLNLCQTTNIEPLNFDRLARCPRMKQLHWVIPF